MLNRQKITLLLSFFVLFLFIAELYAGKGERLWTYKSGNANFDASAAVGDVDRDGYPDIVVVSLTGDVIALDGHGHEIWKTDLDEKITIAPTMVDVTGHSGLEVLVLTHSGNIHCLDGLTGKTVWQNNSLGAIKWACMTIVATDIDQDGDIEILAADMEGTLLCLDGNGKKQWQYHESEGIGSAPAVGDLDGDGKSEIIIASEASPLICLNHKGKVQWRFKPQGDVLSSGRKSEVTAPVVWDLDKDGIAEIITGMGFELVAVNSKGKLIWSYPVKNRIDSAISIADADGDGNMEIYACELSGNMVCVTADGTSKWTVSLGGRARRSPAIADVDGDGIVEILTAGYGSKMNVFDPAGKLEEELLIKGGTNAAPVIADLLKDGGLCAIVPEISGNLVVYRWAPVVKDPEILWPEYRAWASRTAGEFSQNTKTISSHSVQAGPVNITDAEKRTFSDKFSELKKIQGELLKLVPRLKDSKGVLERVHYLSDVIEQAQKSVLKVADLTPIKRRELRDNLAEWHVELFRLLKISKQAVEKGDILVAYAANPWAPFGGMDEIVEERTPEAKITVEAFQGEFESAAANVFNFSGSARTLRVMIDDFSAPENAEAVSVDDVITLREVVDVPTQDSDLSADALPELNTGNLMVVPAWEGRQLWFTINTAKLTSGTWRTRVHLKSLDVQFVETTVELSIRIWDVPLPKEQPLNLCNWSGTTQPEGTFKDQISHGVNVFTRTVPPKATFDESGTITNIDYSEHDAFMAKHAPKGTILFHSLVHLNGPAPAFSETWLKAFKSFIPKWIKHLKEQGFGYENFAFYPQDEPGLEHGKNVQRFMKWAKPVRETDSKIRIYANPVHHITMEQLEEIAPYVDIWTPLQTMGFPKEKLDFIHSTGALMWNYDCSENGKKLSPLNYYRGQAWMCWHFGHTGIGFWTYFYNSHFWFQPEAGFEYDMIYEGKGVVTSKRWEAVRDGVEDYTLLYTLKKAAEAAEKSETQKELVRKAQSVFVEKAAVIAEYAKKPKENVNSAGAEEGTDNVRTIVDKRYEMLCKVRRDIAELLVQFKK